MELSPKEEFPVIENFWKSFVLYLWVNKRWGVFFWAIVPIIAFFAIVFRVHQENQIIIQLAGFLFILPVIFFLSEFWKIEEIFIRQFAKDNNLRYEGFLPIEKEIGSLFSQGEDKKIQHVVSGETFGRPFHFFYYSFWEKVGRSSEIYQFTVFDFEFNNTLPHIYLESKTSEGFGPTGNLKALSMESNEWNKKFTLYTAPGAHIPALQIFSPDVMQHFLNLSQVDDIEIIGNQLYIYHAGKIRTKKGLQELHALSKNLVDNITRFLEGVKM